MQSVKTCPAVDTVTASVMTLAAAAADFFLTAAHTDTQTHNTCQSQHSLHVTTEHATLSVIMHVINTTYK